MMAGAIAAIMGHMMKVADREGQSNKTGWILGLQNNETAILTWSFKLLLLREREINCHCYFGLYSS